MSEKNTDELVEILKNTHIKDFNKYCNENSKSLNDPANSFYVYIKDLLNERKITQQKIFIDADIPERYGYKLLSGEKRTKQRDVILRICYAARLNLSETQKALKKYPMPELYAKVPRDAALMIIFNERPGNIIEVNSFLKENGFDPLRTSGFQD